MSQELIHIVNSKLIISVEMQHYLMGKGYNLCIYGDFDEFLEKFHTSRKPDILIFEVISLTPELVENIQELRKMPELYNIPCIAVLNRATQNLVLFLAQVGIKEIIVKPFLKDALLAKIDKIIAPVESGHFRIHNAIHPDDYTIIELLTQLDANNSNKMDQYLGRLIKKGFKKVALDFRRVAHIDSSGIGILVVCKKRMDIAHGEFKIGNMNQQILSVLQSLQLDKILDIVDNVGDLQIGIAESIGKDQDTDSHQHHVEASDLTDSSGMNDR
jgi:anti-sigma B factor antagonist